MIETKLKKAKTSQQKKWQIIREYSNNKSRTHKYQYKYLMIKNNQREKKEDCLNTYKVGIPKQKTRKK